jgi:hypothetical protein
MPLPLPLCGPEKAIQVFGSASAAALKDFRRYFMYWRDPVCAARATTLRLA